jgi:flagellar biosynthesis protein FlhG
VVNDQAQGLRQMRQNPKNYPNVDFSRAASSKGINEQTKNAVKVIAVASGKGGVGKTNVSVNLGVALQNMGLRVVLMDADMALANVDIMLGLQSKYNLAHVLDGRKTIKEVMIEGPSGLKVIPASSGIQKMAQLSVTENSGIINAFTELEGDMDVLIVDTAAGIADSVVNFCRAAQEVLVVVTDEPASITDAYALIKVLNRDYEVMHFRIVANLAKSARQGQILFQKLQAVATQFLDVNLEYLGSVPYDTQLKEAVQKQVPITLYRPNSSSARSFVLMAKQLQDLPANYSASGYLQFFIESMFQS